MKGILNSHWERNQEFSPLMTLNDESNMPWRGPVLDLWMTIMRPNYDLNISQEIYDFWGILPYTYWQMIMENTIGIGRSDSGLVVIWLVSHKPLIFGPEVNTFRNLIYKATMVHSRHSALFSIFVTLHMLTCLDSIQWTMITYTSWQ